MCVSTNLEFKGGCHKMFFIRAHDKQAFLTYFSISPRSSIDSVLLLNWQLGEILIGVNTSIMNVLVLKVLQVGLLSLKFWLRACMVCMTPGSQDLLKLNGRISQRNRNRIRKYLGLLIRGLNGFKSLHTPFKVWKLLSLQL